MSKKNSFIKGAITLSIAGLLSKLIGFSYRMILPRLIGAEGVGIYQLAYPIYTTLLIISTSGIPIALAKIVSNNIAKKKYEKAFEYFKTSRKLNFIIGLILSILMLILAKPIIYLFKWDNRSIYSILAISPAIFIVSIITSYRGFFQGLKNMRPTAYSQIIEQLARIISMVFLVKLLLPYGIEFAAAGATFGAVIGAGIALLTLLFIYKKHKKNIWNFTNKKDSNNYNQKKLSKKILLIATPITFGALITPLMSFIDAAIVPSRLQTAGFDNPLALYGQLSGMALVLVHLPTIITRSLATSLMPSISESFAIKNYEFIKKRIKVSLRLTILIALPSAVGLFILSKQLTTIIFSNPDAAIPLRFVSWGVIFISLKQITSSILQGIGKITIPAKNLFIGAIFNAIINYVLTGLPQFGIKGAALGTVTGFAIASILNILYVKKWAKINFNLKKIIIKPLIAVSIMSITVLSNFKIIKLISKNHFNYYNETLNTFLVILIGIITYFLSLLLLKEIKYNDLILIPKFGKKLADFLLKLNLLTK